MKIKRSRFLICVFIISLLVLAGCSDEESKEEKQVETKVNTITPVVVETQPEVEEIKEDNTVKAQPKEPLEKYDDFLRINPYVAGWLKIDDTVINDPVVYTPGSQNHYLHRAIDGTYTQKGTLFIAINWQPNYNNTIIYGHNMKNGTAFGSLAKFADESYGKSHHTIHFDTLYEERDYELYAAFYSQIAEEDLETDEDRAAADVAVEEGEIDLAQDFGDWDLYRQEKDEDNGRFRYYYYTDLSDKADFEYFAKNVKERALYDTGIDAEWGDEFVTMSTCSYHVTNGRFIVVGIRKNDNQ